MTPAEYVLSLLRDADWPLAGRIYGERWVWK